MTAFKRLRDRFLCGRMSNFLMEMRRFTPLPPGVVFDRRHGLATCWWESSTVVETKRRSTAKLVLFFGTRGTLFTDVLSAPFVVDQIIVSVGLIRASCQGDTHLAGAKFGCDRGTVGGVGTDRSGAGAGVAAGVG